MTDAALISGTFADFKLIKTRSAAQVIVEVPIEDADRVLKALGGVPQPGCEKPVALARLAETPPPEAPTEPERRHLEDMRRANQAGMLCKDARFQTYLAEVHGAHFDGLAAMPIKDQADKALKTILGIQSKRELDNLEGKGEAWDRMRADYQMWCKGAILG